MPDITTGSTINCLYLNYQLLYFKGKQGTDVKHEFYIGHILHILILPGPGWFNELGSLSPILCGFAPGFVSCKNGALDSQPQVIKLTSCLPKVDGSLRVLRLTSPIKLTTTI